MSPVTKQEPMTGQGPGARSRPGSVRSNQCISRLCPHLKTLTFFTLCAYQWSLDRAYSGVVGERSERQSNLLRCLDALLLSDGPKSSIN